MSPRAVGVAGADNRHLKLPLVVGATEDMLAGHLVAPVTADRFLRERFVDQHLWRDLHAIRADGRTEDELLATPTKRAYVTRGLLGRETDHIDDHIEARRGELPLEIRKLVAVASEPPHITGQSILALRAVVDSDLGTSRQ